MTKYRGSKARYADELLAVILPHRKPNQTWVEPFMGGGNMLCRVPHEQGPRIASDINEYMVAYLSALANGWEPPLEINESQYNKIKKNPQNYPKELVAFAATSCSFGAGWFETYARGKDARDEARNYARESHDLALRDAIGLKGAQFIHSSYDALTIPPGSLIYCDPPYVNTAGYVDEHQDKWRAYKFWQWADRQVDAGHTVFVSEYTGPRAEAYPTTPMTDEHKALCAQYRALQEEIQRAAEEDVFAAPPPALAEKRAELEAAIKTMEAARGDSARALAARWKVVWEKEVVVNFSSDIGEGEAKKVVEKLFHRST